MIEVFCYLVTELRSKLVSLSYFKDSVTRLTDFTDGRIFSRTWLDHLNDKVRFIFNVVLHDLLFSQRNKNSLAIVVFIIFHLFLYSDRGNDVTTGISEELVQQVLFTNDIFISPSCVRVFLIACICLLLFSKNVEYAAFVRPAMCDAVLNKNFSTCTNCSFSECEIMRGRITDVR